MPHAGVRCSWMQPAAYRCVGGRTARVLASTAISAAALRTNSGMDFLTANVMRRDQHSDDIVADCARFATERSVSWRTAPEHPDPVRSAGLTRGRAVVIKSVGFIGRRWIEQRKLRGSCLCSCGESALGGSSDSRSHLRVQHAILLSWWSFVRVAPVGNVQHGAPYLGELAKNMPHSVRPDRALCVRITAMRLCTNSVEAGDSCDPLSGGWQLPDEVARDAGPWLTLYKLHSLINHLHALPSSLPSLDRHPPKTSRNRRNVATPAASCIGLRIPADSCSASAQTCKTRKCQHWRSPDTPHEQ